MSMLVPVATTGPRTQDHCTVFSAPATLRVQYDVAKS